MIDLAFFEINLEEVLEDLRFYYENSGKADYNDTALTQIIKRGDNIMACCPFHREKKPSFGISTKDPYKYNCFACGATGTLSDLVSYVLDYNNPIMGYKFLLKNYIVTETEQRTSLEIEKILDGGSEKERNYSLPEEEIKEYINKRHLYMYKRGLTEHSIKKYEVGYDEKAQAVTFPVRTSSGTLRFIQRRNVHSKIFMNKSGVYKKDIIYGLWYILQAPTKITEVYLTESIIDTISCYEARLPSGSVLGRVLFKEQVKELLAAGIETVNLFFDNDMYGVLATLEAFDKLIHTPMKVNVIIYPNGHWGIDGLEKMHYKDANDLLLSNQIKNITKVPYLDFLSKLKISKNQIYNIMKGEK